MKKRERFLFVCYIKLFPHSQEKHLWKDTLQYKFFKGNHQFFTWLLCPLLPSSLRKHSISLIINRMTLIPPFWNPLGELSPLYFVLCPHKCEMLIPEPTWLWQDSLWEPLVLRVLEKCATGYRVLQLGALHWSVCHRLTC